MSHRVILLYGPSMSVTNIFMLSKYQHTGCPVIMGRRDDRIRRISTLTTLCQTRIPVNPEFPLTRSDCRTIFVTLLSIVVSFLKYIISIFRRALIQLPLNYFLPSRKSIPVNYRFKNDSFNAFGDVDVNGCSGCEKIARRSETVLG